MRRLARAAFVAALACAAAASSCTLGGSGAPGCRDGHPEDCAGDEVCRAGACFRYTTPLDAAVADAAPDATAGDAHNVGGD